MPKISTETTHRYEWGTRGQKVYVVRTGNTLHIDIRGGDSIGVGKLQLSYEEFAALFGELDDLFVEWENEHTAWAAAEALTKPVTE